MLNQFQYCEENGIPFAVVIGESELKAGIVKVRNIATREEVNALVIYFTKLIFRVAQYCAW